MTFQPQCLLHISKREEKEREGCLVLAFKTKTYLKCIRVDSYILPLTQKLLWTFCRPVMLHGRVMCENLNTLHSAPSLECLGRRVRPAIAVALCLGAWSTSKAQCDITKYPFHPLGKRAVLSSTYFGRLPRPVRICGTAHIVKKDGANLVWKMGNKNTVLCFPLPQAM